MISEINQTTGNIMDPSQEENRRGLQVYTLSQLMAITGKDKQGNILTGYYDQSFFYLNYDERINIFRLCTPVNSVVTARMNLISAMDCEVVSLKEKEDEIYSNLKNYKNIYDEYSQSDDQQYIIAAGFLLNEIKNYLTDMLPDASNFNTSLLRWKKRIQGQKRDTGKWIKEWMLQPNINDSYEQFIKKIVFDLMIHGSSAIYKEVLHGKIENIYCLPGGSVIPLKNKFVGGANAYVQLMPGIRSTQPQVFFDDELAFINYIPNTARAYGFIPLEALTNKICETLYFDKLMAEQADGTRMPEKMVLITDNSPFGDLNKEFSVPINSGEQKRVEKKINTPLKGGVMTFSGNNAMVVDISRENTMDFQNIRQKDIREEVGLIFQATPLEMNLAGSENTSGRSTSEVQRELYHSKGVLPIIKSIETMWARNILPFRFEHGWSVNYKSEKTEIENIDIITKKIQSGVYSVNEIRVNELNEEPYPEEQYNRPTGAAPQPDGSQINPFNMKQI